MDNIYIESKEDLNILSELLDNYSNRLQNLIATYLNYKKTEIILLASASLFLLIFIYIYILTGMVDSIKYLTILYMAPIMLTAYSILIYVFIGRKKHVKIRDDAILVYKKLNHLIKITSQTREHSISISNITFLVFDFKLTEAEDVLIRAEKIFRL